MKKYICSVNLSQIIESNSKEEACELFIENHDFEDLYPSCKEFRTYKKLKRTKKLNHTRKLRQTNK